MPPTDVVNKIFLMEQAKYKCIVVTKRGPPENLHIAERDLRDPSAGEVRVTSLRVSGVPWRALVSRESPFVVGGYRRRGTSDNTARHPTPTKENGSNAIQKLPRLLPLFLNPDMLISDQPTWSEAGEKSC